MAKRKILASWIGNTDLRTMAADLPPARRQELLAELPGPVPVTGELGPIKTLTEQETFDEILLLSNFRPEWNREFVTWLNRDAKVSRVTLKNPTDYPAIFKIVDAELRKLKDRPDWKDVELSIHLSPGTPAMTAVWLLLGKSRYPARFFQTFQGKAWLTDVPFDLVVDFVPELLRDADSHLQHLTASSPAQVAGFEKIAGDSKAIRLAVGRAQRVAMRSISVLLLGESGTGKEMFARAIHSASPRRAAPFIAINCAALSPQLLESELFGHRKGAFTGADRDHPGAFETADGGTLFLDEVGECDLSMQAKLLRVLQPPAGACPCHRAFSRVGDSKERTADVRIIAATNQDLVQAVQDRRFREDLLFRLAVVTIKLPPLRDRKGDTARIAEHLMGEINGFFRNEPGYRDKSISDSAMEFVKRHSWPGNVRQLYNALLQAAVMAEQDILQRQDIAEAVTEIFGSQLQKSDPLEHSLGDGFKLENHLNEIHRHYLRRAMAEARGVKAKAARLLGIDHYQTLDAQLERLRIEGEWN